MIFERTPKLFRIFLFRVKERARLNLRVKLAIGIMWSIVVNFGQFQGVVYRPATKVERVQLHFVTRAQNN